MNATSEPPSPVRSVESLREALSQAESAANEARKAVVSADVDVSVALVVMESIEREIADAEKAAEVVEPVVAPVAVDPFDGIPACPFCPDSVSRRAPEIVHDGVVLGHVRVFVFPHGVEWTAFCRGVGGELATNFPASTRADAEAAVWSYARREGVLSAGALVNAA